MRVVCSVHVHHDQSVRILRKDINTGELRECEAKRVLIGE